MFYKLNSVYCLGRIDNHGCMDPCMQTHENFKGVGYDINFLKDSTFNVFCHVTVQTDQMTYYTNYNEV